MTLKTTEVWKIGQCHRKSPLGLFFAGKGQQQTNQPNDQAGG